MIEIGCLIKPVDFCLSGISGPSGLGVTLSAVILAGNKHVTCIPFALERSSGRRITVRHIGDPDSSGWHRVYCG